MATESVRHGRNVDSGTLDWLLAQVDFAINSLAREDANWDDEQRSKLVELLLGVANLNEYARRSTVITQRLS